MYSLYKQKTDLMYNISTISLGILTVTTLLTFSCSNNKAAARKAFLDKCNLSAQQQAGIMGEKYQAVFDEYCECSAKILIDNKSPAEIMEFDKLSNTEDPSKMQAIMEEIKPCIEALQNKASQMETK